METNWKHLSFKAVLLAIRSALQSHNTLEITRHTISCHTGAYVHAQGPTYPHAGLYIHKGPKHPHRGLRTHTKVSIPTQGLLHIPTPRPTYPHRGRCEYPHRGLHTHTGAYIPTQGPIYPHRGLAYTQTGAHIPHRGLCI